MDFKIQRFLPGHPLYSNASVTNTVASRGVVGSFKPVFGQMLTEDGKFICYTMERSDTLIPCQTYDYDLYDSPHNKLVVPRLIKDEKGIDISKRELEIHPANYLWQLKGCTSPGLLIDKAQSAILSSRLAFGEIKAMIGNDTGGKITYENCVEN